MRQRTPAKSFSTRLVDTAVGAIARQPVKNDTYPGENHGILKMPNGSLERAAYMGPGTQVIKRLKFGVRGKTPVDRIAQRHDIDYSLATTPEEVRQADLRMVNSTANVSRARQDHPFNIAQANLMKPKIFAEKYLGANRFGFADLKGPASELDRRILLANRR